jgi:hypothetical protein
MSSDLSALLVRIADLEADVERLEAENAALLAQTLTRSAGRIGEHSACRFCGHDIEFHGLQFGWVDRGAGRACQPYVDRETREVIPAPKTKHAPPRNRHG